MHNRTSETQLDLAPASIPACLAAGGASGAALVRERHLPFPAQLGRVPKGAFVPRGSDSARPHHATLRFDPDCVRKSLDGMIVVARVDVLRPDLPAPCRKNVYASHHESPAAINAVTRQTVPNERRFAIHSASHNG